MIINGGGASSNFSDFTINAGVAATFDGLVITGGHATGAAGSGHGVHHMNAGSAAAGGIFDAGTLTLSNSALVGDTATGGSGGVALGAEYGGGYGGGAGGSAAGGIYVTGTGTLNLQSDTAFANVATGGQGGAGQMSFAGESPGGAGGAGAISDRSIPASSGAAGAAYGGYAGGAGGAPGQPGQLGGNLFFDSTGGFGGGGGGGGGFAFADVGGAGTINGSIACYCPGTLIETARGEKPVEKLEIGDKVMTVSGVLRPIKWIGRRSYGGRFVMGRKDILPVCIKAGALGANLPRRDLWISPHHAMYLEGVLIEARDLVNGASVVQAERADQVEYFHIELDSHDVIIAEGSPSESFIDDDSRGMFHNAHEYGALYPDAAQRAALYYAPRLDSGYKVEAARRHIDARAGLRGAARTQPQTLRGHVDVVTPYLIAGWAQNTEHPEAPGVPRYLCRRPVDWTGFGEPLSRRPRRCRARQWKSLFRVQGPDQYPVRAAFDRSPKIARWLHARPERRNTTRWMIRPNRAGARDSSVYDGAISKARRARQQGLRSLRRLHPLREIRRSRRGDPQAAGSGSSSICPRCGK